VTFYAVVDDTLSPDFPQLRIEERELTGGRAELRHLRVVG
jgi:hypothetical protein